MHQRLQAWLRENKSDDVEYLGYYDDVLGQPNYWYRIGKYDVTVDCIEDITLAEEMTEVKLIRIVTGEEVVTEVTETTRLQLQ